MRRSILLCCCAVLCTLGCIRKAVPKEKPEVYLQILESARSQTAESLAQAAIKLGDMREKRAVEPLLPLLAHADARVRLQTAMALGQLGDQRAAAPLLKALTAEKFGPTRSIIAWALGETGTQDAKEALNAIMLTEKSRGVYGGKARTNQKYLKVLEKAVSKIETRLRSRA